MWCARRHVKLLPCVWCAHVGPPLRCGAVRAGADLPQPPPRRHAIVSRPRGTVVSTFSSEPPRHVDRRASGVLSTRRSARRAAAAAFRVCSPSPTLPSSPLCRRSRRSARCLLPPRRVARSVVVSSPPHVCVARGQADVCQLGVDQRKVNMLAREYCDACGKKKREPVLLSELRRLRMWSGEETRDEIRLRHTVLSTQARSSSPSSSRTTCSTGSSRGRRRCPSPTPTRPSSWRYRGPTTASCYVFFDLGAF